jgi:hypothetical protein
MEREDARMENTDAINLLVTALAEAREILEQDDEPREETAAPADA